MTTKLKLLIILFFGITYHAFGQVIYENEFYNYKVEIPSDWTLYNEIKNDTLNHYSIVDWGLPKVYSEIEKTNIENSISVSAIKRPNIRNINELIDFEFNSKKNFIKNIILIDSIVHSFKIESKIRGLDYTSKQYFIFKNDIGYVIAFTATPGTFDKNIMKFEEFYKSLLIKE